MEKANRRKYLSVLGVLKSAAVIIAASALLLCFSVVCGHAALGYYGKYRGVVSNVNDPLGKGRIKAKVPDVFGDVESAWAMPSLPFGLISLPALNDSVWIEFEVGGNTDLPIWSGNWGLAGTVTDPSIRRLETVSGHQIILDDNGRTLQIVHPGGGEITITDTEIKLIKGSASLVVGGEGVIIQ